MPNSTRRVRPVRPLVLVVDDARDNREMYCEYLEAEGFETVSASDGASAIALSRRRKPDVVIMDISMPKIDGLEATRILRADADLADVPVLVLSAHAFAGTEQDAIAAGADAYVAKPCLPAQLVIEIERLLVGAPASRRRSS